MRIYRVLFVLLVIFISENVLAQNTNVAVPDISKFSEISEFCETKTCIEAMGNVWLRDSAPSRFFYINGEKIEPVSKNEILVVLKKEEVKTLFNSYEWLNVRRLSFDSEGNKIETKKETGWVYNGNLDGQNYFELVNPQKFIENKE